MLLEWTLEQASKITRTNRVQGVQIIEVYDLYGNLNGYDLN